MNMQTIAAVAIIGCILCLVLRTYHRPQAVLLGIVICVVLLLGASPELHRIVTAAAGLYAESSLSPDYFNILCKAVGITWLTQLGTDICKDCGENAIGTAVTLCGRICLVALSLPLFVTLTETVLEVMQ